MDCKKDHVLPISILISAIIIAGAWIYSTGLKTKNDESGAYLEEIPQTKKTLTLKEEIVPPEGIVLPVIWGDLGNKLVDAGAIDAEKFEAVYNERSVFTDEYRNLLTEKNDSRLKITEENAGYLLNLFWALGLANKNPILENGEMTNRAYGGAQNFASTAGWTLAKGNPMDHYSHHRFFNLTMEQQALVDKVSRGIYRPCCNNPTHFPDCNHGMAMLGLLELMASQNASEQDMWKTALAVNSYWFPDTYITIAAYMKNKNVEWKDTNPREVLGANYSGASGYAKIASQVVIPDDSRSKGGCSV